MKKPAIQILLGAAILITLLVILRRPAKPMDSEPDSGTPVANQEPPPTPEAPLPSTPTQATGYGSPDDPLIARLDPATKTLESLGYKILVPAQFLGNTASITVQNATGAPFTVSFIREWKTDLGKPVASIGVRVDGPEIASPAEKDRIAAAMRELNLR